MRAAWKILLCVLMGGDLAVSLAATAPTSEEMATARSWVEANLGPRAARLPFSFKYDGRPSGDLLPTWKAERASKDLDANRTEYTLAYSDPKTGLQVRCIVVQYKDFPTVEWTLYLRNTATADTPILEEIQALDIRLERNSPGEFLLHHNVGSPESARDYQPLVTLLGPKSVKRISAAGGRPTNSDLCYFNIEQSGAGAILALGWPGQWAAQFAPDEPGGLWIRAGQELTHLKLHPGEEIRTPLVVLQFWKGDWIRSQNIWRRWMIAHNLPRPGGKLVATHFASTYGRPVPTAEVEMAQIDGWTREEIQLDYWIIDAGWHPNPGTWLYTGTWEVDATRFPRGLREVADHAHAKGVKFAVWFEPERVTPGTWLFENHPEWLLSCANEHQPGHRGIPGKLLNLGNPEARRWLTDHISKMLTEQGIDVLRHDFNINPLEYWRAADAPDRQGITENAYVTGYLSYWDELLRRHPGLWIDTCASGGRRNDLETLRRSVPLLRSDYFKDPITQQSQTLGISSWMPNYGSGCGLRDPYTMRSSFCPCFRIGCDMRKPQNDYALLRRTVKEFRQVEPYLLGDFYPLTPYTLAADVWMAWQFDRPETGEGVVQAFRRNECLEDSVRLRLRGLDPAAGYVVTDLDANQPQHMTGSELADPGLLITRSQRPGSALIIYKTTQKGG